MVKIIIMAYKEDIKEVANLNLPWDKLSGCNILITGATGLVGSCLVDVLMTHPNKDYQVFATGRNEKRARDRFYDFFYDPSFHFFKYDVIEPLNSNVDFHFIIHAASNASPFFFVSSPVEIIKSNVFGVCNLLDYGKKHNLKRFLFVSTGEVYGEGDGRVFSEEYSGYVNPINPRSCYPSSKRTAETLCVSYGSEYEIDTVIARLSHTYGPYFTESDNRVYAQFIRDVISGQNIIMKSDGRQYRSWCYVVDCVSALLYILLKGNNMEAYNVADESSNISIKELADMVAEIGNKDVVFDIPSVKEEAGFNMVTKSIFSVDKLKSLGWNIHGYMKDKMISTIAEIKRISIQTN